MMFGMKIFKKLILSLCLFWGAQSFAGLLYNYHEMALKDLDQMNKLVSEKLKEAKRSGSGKNVPLKEALQAIYSRPNDDGMIQKVSSGVVSELNEMSLLEKTYRDLTIEALNALKNPKNFKPAVQVTYAVFLENMMAEFKPYLGTSSYKKDLVEQIAKSEVNLTKEATNERKLRMMRESRGPSEIAEDLLNKASKNTANSSLVGGGTESDSAGPTDGSAQADKDLFQEFDSHEWKGKVGQSDATLVKNQISWAQRKKDQEYSYTLTSRGEWTLDELAVLYHKQMVAVCQNGFFVLDSMNYKNNKKEPQYTDEVSIVYHCVSEPWPDKNKPETQAAMMSSVCEKALTSSGRHLKFIENICK